MGSQRPGAWTGSVVTSNGKSMCKSVKKERWTKVQSKVRWLAQHVGLWDAHSSPEAERFLSFLVYIARTYTMFVSYLKGIYLTLNSWRPGRTADGWPFPGFERDLSEVVQDDFVLPICVKIVPSLKSYFYALLKLTVYDEPPTILVCSHC